MSWILSMYEDDDPGEQQEQYFDLAPKIIHKSIEEQLRDSEYTGILENTPRNVIDPSPEALDPLKVVAGMAATTAVVGGLYFGAKAVGKGISSGYNKLTQHRKSPEQQVKEQKAENQQK